MRVLIALLFLNAVANAAIYTNAIISPNGKVEVFRNYPWDAKTVVHTVGGAPVKIDSTSVYLNTTIYWIDGAPYIEDPVDPPALVSFFLPDMSVIEPTTSYPVSFADFTPTVTNVVVPTSAPQIAEYTRQNDSGDTMALTAENLDEDFAHFVFYSEDATSAGGIQLIDGSQAAVTLPDGLTADDMYLMWAMNTNGFGYPVAINKTELWWGDDYIAEGDTFRVYGQNLELDGTAHIYIDEIDEWVSTTNCNPYMAKYTLPVGCTSGNSYTIYAHNGHGDKYGWSDPITIEVWGGYGFSEDTATWIDVTDNAYANLDDTGVSDCTAGLGTIWNAVKNSQTWPVFYFPTGDYLFNSSGLSFWDGSCSGGMFVGDGTNSVIVCQNATTGKGSWKFNRDTFYFRDMAFEKLDVGLSGDQTCAIQFRSDGSVKHLTFENVLFDDRQHNSYLEWSRPMMWSEGPGASPENVRFINCDIISNRHWDLNGENIIWENCNFWGNDDCGGYIGGSLSQLALINCTNYTHWDNSDPLLGAGWGKGRWATSGANKNSRNWYIGGNISYNAQPRYYLGMTSNPSNGDVGSTYNDWNAGEQFMKEGGVCKFRGQALSTTSNTINFSSIFDTENDGLVAVIIGGKGLGQKSQILGATNNILTLAEEWRVQPDSTSIISIGHYADNWAVYDNNLHSDLSAYTYETSASAGFELYYGGGSHGIVVDGNTFNGQLSGVYLELDCTKIFNEPYGNVSPGYFLRIENNIITNCVRGISENSGYDWEVTGGAEFPEDIIILGNVIRKNLLTGITQYVFSSGDTNEISRQMMVFDSNIVEDSDSATFMKTGHVRDNDVWIGNTFSGTGDAFETLAGYTPSVIGNTLTGFTTDYDASYAQFTVPVSIFTTNASPQTVTVQNAGTAALTWTRSNGAGGTIQPEGFDTFTFTSPTSTTFTVSGGGDTKTIHVVE